MARYVLNADTTLDGIDFPRGTIINAPQGLPTIVAHAASLEGVPRARPAGLEFHPLFYVAVPADEQLGWQTADGAMPEEGTIQEPVLPTENSLYD